ncbi:hypothetical protein L0F63_003307, partial [Massospora cicadina]
DGPNPSHLELWVHLGLKDIMVHLVVKVHMDLLALMGLVDPLGLKGPVDRQVQMDLGDPW